MHHLVELDDRLAGVRLHRDAALPRLLQRLLEEALRQVSICDGQTMADSRPLGCGSAASMVCIAASKAFSPAFSSQA